MKQFCILGDIVPAGFAKICDDDVCPSQFKDFVDGLGEGEPFEMVISSPGGDVEGALAIVGFMDEARANGHSVTCHVVGVAASSASVIACAGDELVIDRDALLMIHNPWSGCEGDYRDMEKASKTLDTLRKQLADVYARKFGIGQDAILTLMDAETWIPSSQIAEYGIDASISGDSADRHAIAAKLRTRAKGYLNKTVIEGYMTNTESIEEEDKPTVDEPATSPFRQDTVDDAVTEEKPAEENAPVEEAEPTVEPEDEDDVEALKAEIATLRARVAELEAEKDQTVESRVSGMQAKMQAQINAREKEFKSQLEAKEKELVSAKAQATSLSAELATLQAELSEKTSALAEKDHALAELNAGVLKTGKVETFTRESARAKLASLPMSQRAAFYEEHKDLIG